MDYVVRKTPEGWRIVAIECAMEFTLEGTWTTSNAARRYIDLLIRRSPRVTIEEA